MNIILSLYNLFNTSRKKKNDLGYHHLETITVLYNALKKPWMHIFQSILYKHKHMDLFYIQKDTYVQC